MKLLFCISIAFLTFSCANQWDAKNKAQFINDCIAMSGKKKDCECMLICLEKEFDTYSEVLELVDDITLNFKTNACLKECKN